MPRWSCKRACVNCRRPWKRQHWIWVPGGAGVSPGHPADDSSVFGSAWLLTFSLSLDDVVMSAFLSGPGSTTLPLVIFSRARMGVDPSVNAMATLIIVIVAGVITAAALYAVYAERRRHREISAAWRPQS